MICLWMSKQPLCSFSISILFEIWPSGVCCYILLANEREVVQLTIPETKFSGSYWGQKKRICCLFVCLFCIVWLLKYFPFLLNNIRKSYQYLLCAGLCFRPRHRWVYKHDWYTPFASRELRSMRLNHRCRPAEWGSHGTMYKPERTPGKRHWIRIGFYSYSNKIASKLH